MRFVSLWLKSLLVPSTFSLFSQIIYVVSAPIFLLMGVGFLLQKRLGFDIRTLTRLNFWVFVPAFLFVRVLESQLSSHDIALVVGHFLILGAVLFALTWQIARLIGAEKGLQRAMTSSVIFYNAGNYGVPAAQLAFGAAGLAIQSIVMMMQNTTNFTIGLGLHAGAKMGSRKRDTLRAIWRLPMLQTLSVALLWRFSGWPLPLPLNTAVHYLSDGLVPIALITLGAQMATLKSFRLDLPIALTLFLRLIIAPILAFGLALNANVAQLDAIVGCGREFSGRCQFGAARHRIRQRTGLFERRRLLFDAVFNRHRFRHNFPDAATVIKVSGLQLPLGLHRPNCSCLATKLQVRARR